MHPNDKTFRYSRCIAKKTLKITVAILMTLLLPLTRFVLWGHRILFCLFDNNFRKMLMLYKPTLNHIRLIESAVKQSRFGKRKSNFLYALQKLIVLYITYRWIYRFLQCEGYLTHISQCERYKNSCKDFKLLSLTNYPYIDPSI